MDIEYSCLVGSKIQLTCHLSRSSKRSQYSLLFDTIPREKNIVRFYGYFSLIISQMLQWNKHNCGEESAGTKLQWGVEFAEHTAHTMFVSVLWHSNVHTMS